MFGRCVDALRFGVLSKPVCEPCQAVFKICFWRPPQKLLDALYGQDVGPNIECAPLRIVTANGQAGHARDGVQNFCETVPPSRADIENVLVAFVCERRYECINDVPYVDIIPHHRSRSCACGNGGLVQTCPSPRGAAM